MLTTRYYMPVLILAILSLPFKLYWWKSLGKHENTLLFYQTRKIGLQQTDLGVEKFKPLYSARIILFCMS